MNRLLNYIIIAGMAILAISCADPEDPTPTKMSYGEWYVDQYFVDGQASSGSVIDRFTLERDDSFILVDNNDFVTVGTWMADETSLTLSGSDGSSLVFSIVFQSYNKMHLVQTIESPSAGTIEIRYLMNKDSDGSTY